jgi:hypothetical protein
MKTRLCVRVASLAVVMAGADLMAAGQVIFSEDFSNPTTAATRFSVSGNVSYAGGVMTQQTNPIATLVPGQFFDSGLKPITYEVTQNFVPGSIAPPQMAAAQIRLRGMGSSSEQGYYITTFRNTLDSVLFIGRLTDAERADGILFTTILGDSFYPYLSLRSLGPHDIGISITNSASAVTISVNIDGIFTLTAIDDSPYRITQGDLLELECMGTHAVSWDNLTVSVVPEPSAGAIVLTASVFQMVFRRRRISRET